MAITFKVGFQVDDKELRTGLQGIQKDIENAFQIKGGLTEDIQKATQSAMVLEKAIKRATTDKGISYYSLTAELNKAGTSAKQLVTTLAAGGQNFQASLNAANSALALADRSVISLSNRIKEMSRVMIQSFKFTAAQSTLQAISNAAQEAYQWVYDLDKTITNIGVVTGYTGDQLDKVTQSAIAGAKELRIAANDYAEGALIFYQQGLGDDEVARRVEITAKSARAAGQSLEAMSSQLTAIWNTYQMTGDEMERAASVGAKMAGDTAVDFADIAEAMQTAAAPAEQMGVSYNSLAAIIATVGDTTQQSASVIGNAFKTIFSRFQQLKAEGTDGEVTLNRVSSQLQSLGINVLDASGELRNLDTVIMEVGTQWDSWSQKQQLAVAQLVGGTRQYGQFLTLMQNFDKYQDLLQSANLEDGSALEQQYESSLESIESYAENAGEAWNRAFSNAIDTDVVKGFYSVVEDIGNLFDSILSSIGGLPGILTIVAGIFSSKIVPGLQTAVKNAKLLVTNLTETGRINNIQREYNEIDSSLSDRISQTQRSVNSRSSPYQKQQAKTQVQDLQAEQKKNEFARQTALINEKINTSLKGATGTYKLNLEYQQQQLKTAQDLYQTSVDQLTALQREAEKQKELIALQEKQARAKYATASKGYDQAQANVIVAEENYQRAQDSGDAAAIRQTREELKLANKELDLYRQKMIEAKMDVDLYDTQGLKQFQTALSDLTIQYTKLRSSSDGSFSATDKAFRDFANTLKQTNPQLKTFANSIISSLNATNTNALKNTKKDILELSGNSELASQNIDKIGDKLKEVASGSLTVDQATQQIQELGGFTTDTAGDIQKLIQKYMELRTQNLEKAISDMNELGNETAQAAASQEHLNTLRRATAAGEGVGQAAGRQELAGEGVGKARQSRAGGVSKTVEGLGNMASAATMAVGGINMVTSALKGLEDGSMSTGEALLQMVGSIGMILPSLSMLKGGFGAFQTGMTKLIPALGTASTAASGFGASVAGSFGAAIGAALPFIGIIAAVVAVVGLLVFAWNEYKNTTPEALLDKSKEALEGLTTAAEEAKSAADSLRTSIENYDSAVDTLNDCVVGTQEWEDALKNANEAALELVNNLPDNMDLSGLYSRNNETGLIEFDQDKLAEAQEIADQRAIQAEYAAQVGEISVQQATNRVTQSNLAGSLSDATGYTSSDTYIGSSKSEVNKVLEENLAELANTLSADEFKEKLSELGVNVLQTSEELKPLWEQCQSLASGMENAADKADLFAQMQVDEILGDDYSADVKQIAGEQLAASTEDWEQKYLGALTNGALGSDEMKNQYGNIYQAQSKISDDLIAEYNQLTGKNWQSSGNGVQGTDTNRIFEFINEEGEIIQLRAEQVAAEMAAAKALEEVTGSAEKAAQALANLDSDYSEDFSNFITSGNFNSMTEGEVSENFEVGEDGKVTTESAKEYLLNAFGSEENLQAYADSVGKTVDEVVQEVVDGANVTITAMDNISENLSRTPKKIYDGLIDEGTLENASVESQQAVANMIQNAFTANGEAGAQALSDFIDTATEGLEPEEVDDFIATLGGIDWENVTPEGLREQLENAGFVMDDFTNGSLSELIAKMQEASGLTFDSASENYNKYNDVGKGLDYGSEISDEDYQTLTDGGTNGMAQFFTQTQEGIWILTGDATKFHEELRNQSTMTFEQLKQQQNEQKAIYDGIMNDINSGTITEEDLTESVIGKTNGQEIKDAQLAYLTANKDSLSEDQQTQLMEWTADGATFSADDYATIAEMAKEAGISIDGMRAAQEQLNKEMDQVDEAERMQNLMDTLEENDIDPGPVFEMAEAIQDMAGESDELADSLAAEDDIAQEISKDIARYDKAVEDVTDNYDDWMSALESGNLQDQVEVMDDMRDAYGNLLDIDGDSLSAGFLQNTENLNLMKQAIEGNEDAYNQLMDKANEDILMKVGIEPDSDLWADAMALRSSLDTELADLEIGAHIDNADLINEMNEIINAAGMTAQQATDYLSSMGVDAEVETVEEESTATHKYTGATATVTTQDVESVDPLTGEKVTYSIPSITYEPQEFESTDEQSTPVTSLKVTSATKSSGGGFKFNNSTHASGNNKPTGGGNGGGGGSAPKHQAKKAKKRESLKVEDRYSTTQAKIDDVQRSLDKLSDSQDDMWGGGKLKALANYNKKLGEQAENYKELLELSRDYLEEDQATVLEERANAMKELGANLIGVEYNDDGYVANRTEIINQLDDLLQSKYNEYKAAADAYDAAQSTSEAESERIDKLKEEYDELEESVNYYIEALDQVDETAEKAQEAIQELVEMIRTEIANRVELITYRIELKVDMNDRELELLERSIEHLGDLGITSGRSFDKLAESFNKVKSNAWLAAGGFTDLASMLNQLNTEAGQGYFIEKFGQEAWDTYTETGKIPEEVMSALFDQYENLVSAVDELYDKMDEMFDQYLELLEMYIDKFDEITDKISRNNDKLDLYEQLLEFSGQGYGSRLGMEARQNIAETRVDNAITALHNSQAAYDTFEKQYKNWQTSVEEFQAREGYDSNQYDEPAAAAWNRLQEQGKEIKDAMDQYADEIISNASSVIEAVEELIETGEQIIIERTIDNLNGLFDSVENMMEQFNQKNELRDLWLMDYDKTYQLETLLREIDKQMANVTDPSRLQEYGALIDEINEKNKDGVKVSQNQVDILKAQFEIQKAKDAYEEAQNAKNTMRLARDASGNWNYVYSQDQNESDNAAQQLADAQYQYEQLLHQISDESSERWLSIRQEMIQFAQEINWQLYNTDAAYKQQVDATWKYYTDMTQFYADEITMVNDLLGQDFKDTTLGIITQFDTMEQAQQEYTIEYEKMMDDLEQNTKDCEDIIREECDNMGISYDDLAYVVTQRTNDMKAQNDSLEKNIKELANSADSAMTDMMNSVNVATSQMISDIRALEAEIRNAIALLNSLTNQSLYDWNTDYTDKGATSYYNYAIEHGGDGSYDEDLFNAWAMTSDAQMIAAQRAAKVSSDQMKEFDEQGIYDPLYDATANLTSELEKLRQEIASSDWGNKDYYKDDTSHTNMGGWTGEGYATGALVKDPTIAALAENGAELVLNPSDTVNILEAVRNMREVVRMKMQNLNGSLGKQTAGVTEKTVINKDVQQVEQAVHIDATFPNVSVAKEIEEAFSNLVNQAVQYASQDSRRH